MNKDGRKQGGAAGEDIDAGHRQTRLPAPGATSVTNRMFPQGRQVQQKPVTPISRLPPRVESPGASGTSLAMDAAHRGFVAYQERGLSPEQAHQQSHADAPAVQARGEVGTEDPASIHRAAAAGVRGAGSALPYFDRIQAAFGGHDLGGIRAHVGGEASAAGEHMGAQAYATDDHIAFRTQPDLHTAAHEAAHVVQQRAGVELSGGVGRAGDAYERQADAVADAVMAGQSAVPLLGAAAPGGASRAAV